MKTNSERPQPDEMWVDLFDRRVVLKIEKSEWNLYEGWEHGVNELWLTVFCENVTDDGVFILVKPHWELNVSGVDANVGVGFKAWLPTSHDEDSGYVTNFYSYEHLGTNENVIEILEVKDDEMLIEITGTSPDPNHYDNSKPDCKLHVRTWFKRNEKGSSNLG